MLHSLPTRQCQIPFPQHATQVAKTACLQKLLAELLSPKPQPTQRKMSLPRYGAPPDPMPPLDNHHHPLEDANKTHGRPRFTPPWHSQLSDLRNLLYFPWNEHTATSQRIYRWFYRHRCIFFNWSWGWPWNRCRVFWRAREFELFLCGKKKIKRCSI